MPLSLDKVVRRIVLIGSEKYHVESPLVPIGAKHKSVHVVWKARGIVKVAFFVYLQGDIYDAASSLRVAQDKWRCKVVLVCADTHSAVNARWAAELNGVFFDFRSLSFSELGPKKLAKTGALCQWLGV